MQSLHPLFDHQNFDFEELRHKIIAYTIRDNNGRYSHDEIRKCRMVTWNWLQITSKVLQRFQLPLFHLLVDEDHSFDGVRFYENKKVIHSIAENSLPIAVKIRSKFGQPNLHKLKDVLVKLKMCVKPKDSWNLFPANSIFPVLQDLSIMFTEDTQDRAVSVQYILDSCPALKNFSLPSGRRVFYNVVLPMKFSAVILPATLTVIDLSTKIESEHLEVLKRCPLPNLKRLTLLVCLSPFAPGLIFGVLDNVKRSLEYLFIQGEGHDGSSVTPTYFRFPTMDQLTQLAMESQHFELEPGLLSLETVLPRLTKLRLMLQTETMIDKWTKSNSTLASVSDLYVTMTNDQFNDSQHEYHVNLNEDSIIHISKTFPRVKEFTIDFRQKDYVALRQVWKRMQQIEMLSLCVGSARKVDEGIWTSILLGNDLTLANGAKAKKLKNDGHYSIRNLSNMRTLNIIYEKYGRQNKNENRLLADEVFEKALLKMSNLISISLGKKYWASEKMTRLWKESGRKMDYNFDELDRLFQCWK